MRFYATTASLNIAMELLEAVNLTIHILTLPKVVSGRIAKTQSTSSVPRIITLGGDHTTTLPALRSAASRWGKLSVIHFDSHIGDEEQRPTRKRGIS